MEMNQTMPDKACTTCTRRKTFTLRATAPGFSSGRQRQRGFLAHSRQKVGPSELTPCSQINYDSRRFKKAFTLIELLVVIAIIVLVTGAVLPSVLKVFSAGADAQAYNLLSAQLTAARALAITEGQYAGVHVQLAAADSRQAGNCYLSVVQYVDINANNAYDPNWRFRVADGFTPRRAPGGFAFGQLNPLNDGTGGEVVSSSDDRFNPDALDDTSGAPSNLDDFTTFTILFSPSGDLSKTVNGGPIFFDETRDSNDRENNVFDNFTNPGGATYLWDPVVANFPSGAGEGSATAVTMFNYGEFSKITGPNINVGRANYLNGDRRFIAVNVYTGQLFRRE